MLRNIALVAATLVLGLTAFGAQAQAASTAQCDAMLDDVEIAQVSIEAYDASIVELDSERTELAAAVTSLDARIAKATGKAMLELRGKRDAMVHELLVIDELRPDIVAQRDALRAQIEQSERGYIACIETAIGN